MGWYDRKVRWVRDLSCGDTRIFLELEVRRVDCRRCSKVKRERLDFLADNPLYTKRFAYFVGRRCRGATVKEVAEELALDWHTVKALDQQYMEAQLKRAGTPGPQVIGVDEIAIRKGHTYRIVVSDLVRGRPIWFGGQDRSEASMSQFYGWLGKRKSSRIRLPSLSRATPSAVSEHSSELIGCPISTSLTTCCVCPELRSLPSPGVTRLQRYCEPLRHPGAPGLSLAGVRLVIADHASGLPVLRTPSLCTCCRHYPGAAAGRTDSLTHPSRISLPRKGRRVGLRIVLFEACSAFTRVTACTLALSPYFVTR